MTAIFKGRVPADGDDVYTGWVATCIPERIDMRQVEEALEYLRAASDRLDCTEAGSWLQRIDDEEVAEALVNQAIAILEGDA